MQEGERRRLAVGLGLIVMVEEIGSIVWVAGKEEKKESKVGY